MSTVRLLDIAQKMGLSVATVSRALNPVSAHLISEEVRLRIQNTAGRMGYVANHTAQQLVHGRSYTIGVVLATAFDSLFFSDFNTRVLTGLYAVLQSQKRYGCKLVMLPREKPLPEMDRYILSSQVDGLLISTQCDFSADALLTLAESLQLRSRRPVVALNLPIRKKSRISVVTYDNRAAARQAVDYLIERGRRQIGLIYADNNSEDARERVEGYKQALAARNLQIRPEWMVRGDFSTPSGHRAAMEILRAKKSCDALFCLNDEMAIGALLAIRDAGNRCPEDIAVMGFDGIAAGDLTYPRLSTIAQPVIEMATAATRLLLDRIEGKRSPARSFLIPPKLIVRDSTP